MNQCGFVALSMDQETTICCGRTKNHKGDHTCVYCLGRAARRDSQSCWYCTKAKWFPNRDAAIKSTK